MSTEPAAIPEIVVSPSGVVAGNSLDSSAQIARLALLFGGRELLLRYGRTYLGLLWAIVRPLLAGLILVLVFSHWLRIQTATASYPALVLCGYLPWQFFNSVMLDAISSLTRHSQFIKRFFFPRIALPLSVVVVPSVDFLVTLMLCLGSIGAAGAGASWRLFLLPLAAGLGLLLSCGCALVCATLNALCNDLRFLFVFLLQLSWIASPVGYDSSWGYRTMGPWYGLNPMVGLIDAFRYVLLGVQAPYLEISVACTVVIGCLALWAGVFLFRRYDAVITDMQ